MSIYVKTDKTISSVGSLFETFRNSYLGSTIFMMTFCKIQNGFLRSSSVVIPWSSDEVNVRLTKINIPGLSVIAIDYKQIGWFNKHTIYVWTNTKGANGASDLAQQCAEVSITITKK
jgi:hypothetical protein